MNDVIVLTEEEKLFLRGCIYMSANEGLYTFYDCFNDRYLMSGTIQAEFIQKMLSKLGADEEEINEIMSL